MMPMDAVHVVGARCKSQSCRYALQISAMRHISHETYQPCVLGVCIALSRRALPASTLQERLVDQDLIFGAR